MAASRRAMRALSGRVPSSQSVNTSRHTEGCRNAGGVSTSPVVSRHGTNRNPDTPMATTSSESVQAAGAQSSTRRGGADAGTGDSAAGDPVVTHRQAVMVSSASAPTAPHTRRVRRPVRHASSDTAMR